MRRAASRWSFKIAMEHRDTLRWMVLNAAMMALGLTLPVAFHAVGLGSKFLPMLLPVLLNGFLSPVGWAVVVGVLTPLISSLATGMPPMFPPVAGVMMVEGAVLAATASIVYRAAGKRIWPALITAILCGRLTSAGLSWVMAAALDLPARLSVAALLIQGLPGVALQLAVIPPVVRNLRARRSPLFEHV